MERPFYRAQNLEGSIKKVNHFTCKNKGIRGKSRRSSSIVLQNRNFLKQILIPYAKWIKDQNISQKCLKKKYLYTDGTKLQSHQRKDNKSNRPKS